MNIFTAAGRLLESGSNALVTGCGAINKICQMADDAASAGVVQTKFLVEISEQDVRERRIKFKAGIAEAEAAVQQAEARLALGIPKDDKSEE